LETDHRLEDELKQQLKERLGNDEGLVQAILDSLELV